MILDWNETNSVGKGLLFEPVMWETHVFPEMAEGGPQEVVNHQIVESADILIGIFWTRVGTPTRDFPSGTIEEIQQFIDSKKTTLLYFSNQPIHPDRIDFQQHNQVKKFKEHCSHTGIINTYTELNEFKENVKRSLNNLAKKIQSDLEKNEKLDTVRPLKKTRCIQLSI